MADEFDVIVDFSTNEAANQKVVDNVSSIREEIEKLEKEALAAGKTLRQVISENIGLYQKLAKATEEATAAKEKEERQNKRALEAARDQARVYQSQATFLNQQARQFTLQAEQLRRVESQVASFGRIALVAGTALAGGLFKAANDFIKNAPEATRLTIQWTEAQKSLSDSYSRVGKVAAEAALPILRKTAELAERASKFIEANPELVSAALNAGLITAGLGALGILVSKGIKLYADVLYLQAVPLQQEAARLQLLASEQMLAAARIQAGAGAEDIVDDIPIPRKGLGGAGAFLGLLGEAAVLLGSFAAGLLVADKAFDAIQKHDVTFKDYLTTFKQTLAIDAKKFGDWLEGIGIKQPGGGTRFLFQRDTGEQMFKQVAESLGLLKSEADSTADSLDNLTLSVRNSKNFEKILNAYEDYRNDDLELIREHNEDRARINQDGLDAINSSDRKYAKSVIDINNNTNKALLDNHKQYEAASIKAEQDYYASRAEAIRDESEDIKRIEEELQESLRKSRIEHSNRTIDLLAQRDAVGLIKESRRFEQEQAEDRRQANIEIRRRRQELGRRLEEMEAEFEAEKAARYQDYVQRAIEIRQQAVERLAELRQQHLEELAQIRAQTAQRLKEADNQFNSERRRRYEYFLQQVRDLDAALLGERNLRVQYYNTMANDLDIFLARYRAGLASLNNVASHPPGKAEGNYTTGLVRTGERGYEWIATHESTVAAERMIGGRLTQEIFLKAIRALQGGGSATYVDQRRMEAPLSKEQREMYRTSALDVVDNMLGGLR